MSHTLVFSSGSTIAVFADGLDFKTNSVIAKHQILDAYWTTMQYMGSESTGLDLHFAINSQADTDLINGYAKTGNPVFYTDDKGNSGSYVVMGFSYKRLQALNYVEPWYSCTLNMVNMPFSGSLYYQWTIPAPPR